MSGSIVVISSIPGASMSISPLPLPLYGMLPATAFDLFVHEHVYYYSQCRIMSKRSHLQSPNPIKQRVLESSTVVAAVDQIDSSSEPPNGYDLAAISPASTLPAARESKGSSPALTVVNAIANGDGNVISAPALSPPSSQISDGGVAAAAPSSPGTNRSKFLAGRLPVRLCCNLDLIKSAAGAKLSLTAICIAVYPASSNPDRRYITIADSTGSTGLTVWNSNVHKFGFSSVGKMVVAQKMVLATHNSKRCLTMTRESSIDIFDDGNHAVVDWWNSLLTFPPLNSLQAHDAPDNALVCIQGVLGHVSSETKMVGGISKLLTTLHLADETGQFDIRSWNHAATQFTPLIDSPILIKRVRMTSFSGTKIGELLDGSASVVESVFKGSDRLLAFWNASA